MKRLRPSRLLRCATTWVAVLLSLPMLSHADDEAETRLREQLRQTMLQLRQLQDENSELQVKAAAAQTIPVQPVPERNSSRAEVEKLRAEMDIQAMDTRSALMAAQEQNTYLQEKLAAAEKQLATKSAAADDSSAKLADSSAQLTACEKDNADLVDISGGVLQRYHDMSFFEALYSSELLTGLGHQRREMLVDKYRAAIKAATLDKKPE